MKRRLWLAVGWVKFHGWSNAYWQYDVGHWLCTHPEGPTTFDRGTPWETTLCLYCGDTLRPAADDARQTSFDAYRFNVWGRWRGES